MYSDGHTGLSNKKVNEVQTDNFDFALSFLKTQYEERFVIHVWPKTFVNGIQHGEILERLGLKKFGRCNVLGGQCYYFEWFEIRRGAYGEPDQTQVQRVHDMFKKFASNWDEIARQIQQVDRRLRDVGVVGFPWEGARVQVGEITPGAPPKEALYEEAKEYDAYKDIRAIVKEAKEELIVIDPYVDSSLLGLFENAESSVSICVLTWNMKGDFQLAAEKFKSQRGAVEIRVGQGEFHDRFMIADSKCFHLGASIKDAGKRVFMISRIEDAINIQALRQVFNKSWNDATVVV